MISWKDGGQNTLELLVEPRHRFSRRLLDQLESTASHLVMFTSPHRKSVLIDEYESVVMIASGFGIVAHLLEQLTYSYNARKSRTRRIHVLWQVKNYKGTLQFASPNSILTNSGPEMAVLEMLDKVLKREGSLVSMQSVE